MSEFKYTGCEQNLEIIIERLVKVLVEFQEGVEGSEMSSQQIKTPSSLPTDESPLLIPISLFLESLDLQQLPPLDDDERKTAQLEEQREHKLPQAAQILWKN